MYLYLIGENFILVIGNVMFLFRYLNSFLERSIVEIVRVLKNECLRNFI